MYGGDESVAFAIDNDIFAKAFGNELHTLYEYLIK
jgi:hypothetical protein